MLVIESHLAGVGMPPDPKNTMDLTHSTQIKTTFLKRYHRREERKKIVKVSNPNTSCHKQTQASMFFLDLFHNKKMLLLSCSHLQDRIAGFITVTLVTNPVH